MKNHHCCQSFSLAVAVIVVAESMYVNNKIILENK